MNKQKEAEAIERLKQYAPPENEKYWTNGESVMKWWLEEDPSHLTFFDDDEIAYIMYEMGLT